MDSIRAEILLWYVFKQEIQQCVQAFFKVAEEEILNKGVLAQKTNSFTFIVLFIHWVFYSRVLTPAASSSSLLCLSFNSASFCFLPLYIQHVTHNPFFFLSAIYLFWSFMTPPDRRGLLSSLLSLLFISPSRTVGALDISLLLVAGSVKANLRGKTQRSFSALSV